MQSPDEELLDKVVEHRQEAKITCSKDCWCWPAVETVITCQELKERAEVNRQVRCLGRCIVLDSVVIACAIVLIKVFFK